LGGPKSPPPFGGDAAEICGDTVKRSFIDIVELGRDAQAAAFCFDGKMFVTFCVSEE
jgi:hypothetical protein